ncbi:MAG: hypothetical protein RBR41_03100 [Desulfovibrio sp.]|uniref:hypothetical protein n=1 Tax=Desulfovibrio sp. TaxID=885 RepID=UPI002A36B789|nr:hypothetical protein [Desulfovibrio sp.]MDY0258638.1 hypothetical protein [Desulfovibrio sp.]
MGSFFASSSAQSAGKGAVTGYQTGSSIANAQYNAAAMRMQADAQDEQTRLTGYLIRKQYESDYRTLVEKQEQQQSMNRVVAMKRGITGASATAVLSAHTAKGQQNLEQLYYNAAMKTGTMSLQNSARASGLRERANQYDWQATSSAVAGLVGFGAGVLSLESKYGTKTESPEDSVMSEEKISSEFYGSSGSYNGLYSRGDTSGMSSMSSLPSLRS